MGAGGWKMTKESSGYGDSGQTVFDKAFAEGRPGDKAWGGGGNRRNLITYQGWGVLAKLTQWAKERAQGRDLLRKRTHSGA